MGLESLCVSATEVTGRAVCTGKNVSILILKHVAIPRQQGSWGQHGAHLGTTGPRWTPCWPREPCYLGIQLRTCCRIPHTMWSFRLTRIMRNKCRSLLSDMAVLLHLLCRLRKYIHEQIDTISVADDLS